MAGSIYDQVAEEYFEELCDEDSRWLILAAETSRKLRRGFYQEDIVAALGQYHFTPPLSEVHSFMMLWGHLQAGDVALAKVKIGHYPSKDADIEGNNDALQDLARRWSGYLEAEFWGGLSDHDGFINVLRPLQFDTTNKPQVTIEYGGRNSASFPLEVGTQTWSKTLHMMRVQGSLARWPYGSKYIWLFVMRQEVRDSIQAYLHQTLLQPLMCSVIIKQ